MLNNSRQFDGVIQNVLTESEKTRTDGIKYLENSKGYKITILLNNNLIGNGILTEFQNDYMNHCVLLKFDDGKTHKFPIAYKITVEDDEDMEFPTVYFDFRRKEVSDETLIEKEDTKSFEELAYKMAHGGPSKKKSRTTGDRYDQAILVFEIDRPRLM
jgi:hypothetical protein